MFDVVIGIEHSKLLGRMTMANDKYYGLNELDYKIAEYLNFDNGFFFEAGANDGIAQSNTLHFERHRGWSGILVEPIPSRFSICRQMRPRSDCVWAALVPNGWPDPFVELTFCNLMTVTNSDEVLLDRKQHIQSGQQWLADEQPHSFHAPARTISSILTERQVTRVDLLSLDVEGFEVAALRGIDLDKFEIRYICVEARNIDMVCSVLEPHYILVEKLSHHDYLFKLKH